jgi:hypothetical protein
LVSTHAFITSSIFSIKKETLCSIKQKFFQTVFLLQL